VPIASENYEGGVGGRHWQWACDGEPILGAKRISARGRQSRAISWVWL